MGVGSHKVETYPPYFLEMANKNSDKTYLMVHCDSNLPRNEVEQKGNLTIKHIKKNFPTKLCSHSFSREFQTMIESILKRGGEVFLGVHNTCWTDMQSCMGDTYNALREKYAGKIHLYIQCSDVPAFVYKGPYHPIMGRFACHLFWRKRWSIIENIYPSDWSRLVLHCSPHASVVESEKLALVAKNFFYKLTSELDPQANDQIINNTLYQTLEKYIKEPLTHKVVIIPLERLTSRMFYEELPPSENYAKDNKVVLGLLGLTAALVGYLFMNQFELDYC